MELQVPKLMNFLKDEGGATAAEYVLILALIGSAVVVGAGLLGTSISNALSKAATYITTKTSVFS